MLLKVKPCGSGALRPTFQPDCRATMKPLPDLPGEASIRGSGISINGVGIMFQSAVGEKQKEARKIQRQSSHKQAREAEPFSSHAYGNQALLRMGRAGGMSSVTPLRPSQTIMLQRKCAACEEEDKKLRRKESEIVAGTSTSVSPVVHEVLGSPGQPLDPATKDFFEPRFGHDFSQVRVHTDEKAAESARAVNALAYTVGNNVVFGSGRYVPDTPQGRNLVAHELTHVIQQHRGPDATLQRAAEDAGAEDASEEEAKTTAIETTGSGNADQLKAEPTKAPKCTRNIFAEGTCADLVAGSRFICCDPDNGIERKGKKTDIEGNPCPSEKFTPIFTCDNKCEKALANGCSDSDNWMAVPNNQFKKSQCGDTWTICANGKQTTGYVRDHSVTQTRFEVSPKIQTDLGVTVGSSFKGSIYRPGANQGIIDKDSCCKV
ncbi:MAG: DUF4157 domain-containing protein [Methylococcaceae bacterium]|nr:DUF4157 domain-containing protein [Methylococcaceae bacterium]